jgi:hypothetical protein
VAKRIAVAILPSCAPIERLVSAGQPERYPFEEAVPPIAAGWTSMELKRSPAWCLSPLDAAPMREGVWIAAVFYGPNFDFIL